MKGHQKAIIIGSGIGGLATALRLVCKGYEVHVYEKNPVPGGKVRELHWQGFRWDMGPSLFTLPELLDELFQLCGKNPADYFNYHQLDPITRYFFSDGRIFNAHANVDALAEEFEAYLGEPKENVLKYLKDAAIKYRLSADIFLFSPLNKWETYRKNLTLWKLTHLPALESFSTMHQANTKCFKQQATVQFFDRYATYNGSDPMRAPATLNVIAHLEHSLGAYFLHGGMFQLTRSLVKLAEEMGVHFHLNQEVTEIIVEKDQVNGIKSKGDSIHANIVVSNMDIVPTYRRLMPKQKAPEKILSQERSSSALIFLLAIDHRFPQVELHNVFFTSDYAAEFKALFQEKTICADPTIYLYCSSKQETADAPPGKENWFIMINAPYDNGQDWEMISAKVKENVIKKLSNILTCDISKKIMFEHVITPKELATSTSSFQGALYGAASNSMFSAFLRHPNFSSQIKNLYFCGGSVHPGGGIPLCLASAKIIDELLPKSK